METEGIEDYILAHSEDESELLKALNRDAHVNLLRPRMLSGHLQGRILKMFCRMMRPKRVLEIGTYTAYATLCMAEGLADDASIDPIEINREAVNTIWWCCGNRPIGNTSSRFADIRFAIGFAIANRNLSA